jgi:hypothetical protein
MGEDFRDAMRPVRPALDIPWAGPIAPGVREERGPNFIDQRNAPEYVRPYLTLNVSPETAAIIKSLDMRKYGDNPFQNERGYDPSSEPPVTKLGADLGVHDFDRRYANLGKFVMPDQERDDYLTLADVNTVKGHPIPTFDQFKEEQAAEAKINDAMEAVPDWEGTKNPTQNDINAMRENPTDQMLQAFEDQFGEGRAADYMDESIQGKVPLPRPRPREPAQLPPITVEKKKRK